MGGRAVVLSGAVDSETVRLALSGLALGALLLALTPSLAPAQQATYLVDIGQSAGLSSLARTLSNGGYELADGAWQPFLGWYRTDWPELHVEFMTQLSESFGLLWGLSSGEWGEKYQIDPALRLGFVAQAYPSETSVLSLTVKTILGGQFTESPCSADYGDIGGEQTVNCRLAASFLPPEETLDYLVGAEPTRLSISLSFRATF